jgi:endonuclease YncB( thermonuclease family)
LSRRLRAWLPLAAIAAAAVGFLVYGSLIGPESPAKLDASSTPDFAPGIVDTVADGDTIHFSDGRRVRLVQIDAPELAGEECYAADAFRELERIVPVGTTVALRPDGALDRRDRFGRVLAYVLEGRTNVNLRLVELGAAAPYFYRGERGRYANTLLAAARGAVAEKRGLWGACPGTHLDPNRAVATKP